MHRHFARSISNCCPKINRHGKGARIRADLTDFGLTEKMAEETFASYMTRYNVIRETKSNA